LFQPPECCGQTSFFLLYEGNPWISDFPHIPNIEQVVALAFSQMCILLIIFGCLALLTCLGVIYEKWWLKTFMSLILFLFHHVIPSLLEHQPSFGFLIKVPCSRYGFLQGLRVVILNLVTIEGG
jgi:hypothetical protein